MNEVDNQSERHNYINERVVETPRKRLKRLIKKVILTGFFAVIFGVVACVVFVYLRPILESTISNPGETTTTVPDNEEPTTEEPTTSEKIYTAEDLKNLYGQVSKLTEEMKKSVVTINAYTGEKGIFQNKDRTITSLVSREEFYAMQSEKFVNDTFEGSLPAFLAAFGTRKKLSEEEVEELKKVIEGMRR